MLFRTYYELIQIKSKFIIKMFMYEKDDKYTHKYANIHELFFSYKL